MSEPWTWKKTATNVGIIALALVLGNLIDQEFAGHINYSKNAIFFIFLQFLVIIAVVAVLETIHLKKFPIPITSNVFFIGVFLSVQQNLWKQVSRIQFYPKLKMLTEDERKQQV